MKSIIHFHWLQNLNTYIWLSKTRCDLTWPLYDPLFYYLVGQYHTSCYSIIWVLCNPLSYYLGTMQPVILLSGYYTTCYPIIWYYATCYPIIWVLCNSLFYYLGTMQPIILLSGYYATHYSIIWVLCNPLFYYLGTMQPAVRCFLGTTSTYPYFLWLWYYLTQHINIFSMSIHLFLLILGYYATHSYYWVLCNPVILILRTMHPGFSLVLA